MNNLLNAIGTLCWIASIGTLLVLSVTSWAGFAVFSIFVLAWWLAAKSR